MAVGYTKHPLRVPIPEVLPPFATFTVMGCVTEASTVKKAEAVLPMLSDAVTVWTPRLVFGTVKLAVNAPVRSAVTVIGVVLCVAPSNLIVTVEEAANIVPVTVTGVPTNQLVGLKVKKGGPGFKTRVARGMS